MISTKSKIAKLLLLTLLAQFFPISPNFAETTGISTATKESAPKTKSESESIITQASPDLLREIEAIEKQIKLHDPCEHSSSVSKRLDELNNSFPSKPNTYAIGSAHYFLGGYCNNSKNKMQAAEKYYRRALKLIQAAVGPNHTDLLEVIDDVAPFFDSIGHHEDALKLYVQLSREACDEISLEACLNKKTLEIGVALMMANVNAALGSQMIAEWYYRKVLNLIEDHFHGSHPFFAQALNDYGVFEFSRNRINRAESLFLRAVAVLQRDPTLSNKLAEIRINLSETYLSQGRLFEAGEQIRMATIDPEASERIAARAQHTLETSGQNCLTRNLCKPVRILFATNRRLVRTKGRIFFNSARAEGITYGQATVTVPQNSLRRQGEIPQPNWIERTFKLIPEFGDPARHFTIPQKGIVRFRTHGHFVAAAAQNAKLSSDAPSHAVIFVHGFNVTFDEALLRAGQIANDLGRNSPFGTVILFSWPSAGRLDGYVYDMDSADLAITQLSDFLRNVALKAHFEKVHIIAHSMGNVSLLGALQKLRKQPVPRAKFGQIVLVAPDIDAAKFRQIADGIDKQAEGVTLYVSSTDMALIVSRRMRGDYPRAGDVPDLGPVVLDGIDTIDISRIPSELFSLQHNKYAGRKELLADMRAIFKTGLRAPIRNKALKPATNEGKLYWVFR